MHRRGPTLRRWILVATAVLLLGGGLALEVVLAHARTRAALETRSTQAIVVTTHDDLPTPEGHEAAARAAGARGDFRESARHAVRAARLRPGDAEAARRADDALELALVARARGVTRPAALLATAFLLFTFVAAGRRRRRDRARATWIASLRPHVRLTVDGGRAASRNPARLRANSASMAIDLFLRPARAPRRAPRPGPTLGVALSHAASGTSLRLTPRHDVRGDAVRMRIKDATLEHILRKPGPWRLQARLDGRLVAETTVVVEPGRSAPGRPHPAGRAAVA